MSVLDAALRAVNLGWRVFPTANKKPLIDEWKANAADTPQEVLDQPWGEADGYAIALPPGVIVVDLDAVDGSLSTAVQELWAADVELHTDFSLVGDIPVVKTRSGGAHLYFRADTENLRQTKLAKHIDLRVGGLGYVVGPGSPGYHGTLPGPDALPFAALPGAAIA
jgi:hypothetical protein